MKNSDIINLVPKINQNGEWSIVNGECVFCLTPER
jgi:hypothetical protein